MEVIKKITILAVLVASVVVIITFSPDIYEGIQTNIQERQATRERWNNLTQEQKCKESLKRRDSFVHEQLNLPNPSLVDSQVTGKVEWVNKSAKREYDSLMSDWRKECGLD